MSHFDDTESSAGAWRSYFGLCGFVLGAGIIGAIALLLNSVIAYSLHRGLSFVLPKVFDVPALWQFFIYTFPVAMLILEWILWDYLTTRYRK